MRIVKTPQLHFKSYQLVFNIYKGDSLLPLTDPGVMPVTFLSVKTQSYILKTRAVSAATTPMYQTRLLFPIMIPTYNDKITIRLWMKNGRTEQFLANVPEYPSSKDFANISVIRPLEGKMEPRWINLYGVDPKEKRSGVPQSGSSFMGRLLLSLHLNQNDRSDKAQLNVGSTFPSMEPATNQYQLWLDLYDLTNCDEILDCRSVWIVASCGQQKTENAYARLNKQNKKSFKWKNNKMQVEKLELDLPRD